MRLAFVRAGVVAGLSLFGFGLIVWALHCGGLVYGREEAAA